jgi:hypothetical protein
MSNITFYSAENKKVALPSSRLSARCPLPAAR